MRRWATWLVAASCIVHSTRCDSLSQSPFSSQTVILGEQHTKTQPNQFDAALPEGTDAESSIVKYEAFDLCVVNQLWYHNSRFYGIRSAASLQAEAGTPFGVQISKNIGVITIPAADLPRFYGNLKAKWLGGQTLLIDQPWPQFPENLGFWLEVLLPLYSLLSSDGWKKAGLGPIDQILFSNLQRQQLQGLEWVWEVISLAVAPVARSGVQLPRTIFYDDFGQVDRSEWLCIEKAALLLDRYTHPGAKTGFWTSAVAARFREEAYRRHGIRFPSAAPNTITLLNNAQNEQIANEKALQQSLRETGRAFGYRLRPLSMTARAPFPSFLGSMARTGILLSRHGPQLANSIFLPPGAIVVELLPFNWNSGAGISDIYRNATWSCADVHHVAWRARHPRWVQYNSTDDERYSSWTAEECQVQACIDVHSRARMIVDVETVVELVGDTIAAVKGMGLKPFKLRPWPTVSEASAGKNWWHAATGKQ